MFNDLTENFEEIQRKLVLSNLKAMMLEEESESANMNSAAEEKPEIDNNELTQVKEQELHQLQESIEDLSNRLQKAQSIIKEQDGLIHAGIFQITYF